MESQRSSEGVASSVNYLPSACVVARRYPLNPQPDTRLKNHEDIIWVLSAILKLARYEVDQGRTLHSGELLSRLHPSACCFLPLPLMARAAAPTPPKSNHNTLICLILRPLEIWK